MPELPDIEVFKQVIDATSLHRRIDDVFLRERLVQGVAPQTIRDRLVGRELVGTTRHGKHLFVHVDAEGWLRLHFGMTGAIAAWSTGEPPTDVHLRLDLEDGSHLAYTDRRLFGEIGWVDDVTTAVEDLGLGPDAMDLDEAGFGAALAGRRGSIKGTLMTQEAIAGLGNVYADEILFHAGLHPEAETDSLDDDEIARLHAVMVDVLDGAIEARADPSAMPSDWLLPHRERGAECPRDGASLRVDDVVGRTTYWCPGHQAPED